MTKSEFVDKVADQSGLSKKDAGAAVDAVIKSIEDALSSGQEVSFTGFGKFHVAAARRARGPQPAHGRDDADRREQGAALHGRLGPQEGHQVARADGRRFVGRRRSVARHPVRRPPGRGRSPSASPRSSWASTPIRPSCGRTRSTGSPSRARGSRWRSPTSSAPPRSTSGRAGAPRGSTPPPRCSATASALIDAAGPACVAVKPQLACFERLGFAGWLALEAAVGHARAQGLLVIADGKRGDIATSAARLRAGAVRRDRHAVRPQRGPRRRRRHAEPAARPRRARAVRRRRRPARRRGVRAGADVEPGRRRLLRRRAGRGRAAVGAGRGAGGRPRVGGARSPASRTSARSPAPPRRSTSRGCAS